MSGELLTTGEYIATLITGGVAVIGTVSATLHKLGIVTLRSPLKLKRNGRGGAENPGNPASQGIPAWCPELRKMCIDTNNKHFEIINTTLQRIEKKQGEQVDVLGAVKGEVAQLVSAYGELNGHTGIIFENLKDRVTDLERAKDGYTDK
jgi:hypothetical protein